MRDAVTDYCAALGRDPMLVQGAGGNVSWKEGLVLHVKASGTWLAQAAQRDIFVPVDLAYLRSAIDAGQFDVTPKMLSDTALRPSIETMLHALMPHPVVVHLHMIEALAYLVRNQCRDALKKALPADLQWVLVDYEKPGKDLAAAINLLLKQQPGIDVLFLKNHGVVIGAEDVAQVKKTVKILLHSLNTIPRATRIPISVEIPKNIGELYFPVADREIHQLAIDEVLFDRIEKDWAVYPDHVVFLGARPFCFPSEESLRGFLISSEQLPKLIFIKNIGVFAQAEFSEAAALQLRCFYDVLSRQAEDCKLDVLSDVQIAALLNWDAEQYRQNLLQSGNL
jgi:rhamnose utilization protein RhaD (predicted bifunctional aldolase and dehydrogenase)